MVHELFKHAATTKPAVSAALGIGEHFFVGLSSSVLLVAGALNAVREPACCSQPMQTSNQSDSCLWSHLVCAFSANG